MSESPPSNLVWTPIASENTPFTLTAPATLRYGADTRWKVKALQAGQYMANNALFGDPAVGATKSAQIQQTVGWVKLADEYQTFTLAARATVRYGIDTRWIEKDLPGGTYAAGNALFGTDPAFGVAKQVQLRALTNTAPPPEAAKPPVVTPPAPTATSTATATAAPKPIPIPVIIVVPPKKPVNWKSVPPISDDSAPYMLPPGDYLNEDPSKPLIQGKYKGRRIIIEGTPQQPMRLRSAGHILAGFRNRWRLTGTLVEALNPGVFGQSPGRVVMGEEILWAEILGNFFDGTSGLLMGGLSGKFGGDAASGERILIGQNRARNIRGMRSDGTRDSSDPMRINPIRSHWGGTHAEADRWNPAVPLDQRTEANKKDPAKFGEIGWDPVQFVMFRHIAGLRRSAVFQNLIENFEGESLVEDNGNVYAGSGGIEGDPLVFSENVFRGGQRLHWDHVPGTPYDGSGQRTEGATSYQNPACTQNSGSAHVMDGHLAGTTPGSYEENSAYVDFIDTLALGVPIGHFAGHHVRYIRERAYESVASAAGDPLVVPRGGFQVTRYDRDNPARAMDRSGVMQDVWGCASMEGCELYAGSKAGGRMLYADGVTDLLYNGGRYDDASNKRFARPAPGFEARLVDAWLADMKRRGLTIGLPTP